MLTRFLHIPTPPGSAHRALSFLRTGMSLRDIPVFRMAYFTIKPHCGLISKTLMLQARFAHPPSTHRNAPSEHSGVPHGLLGSESPPCSLYPKRSCFRLASLTLRCRTEPALRAAPVFQWAGEASLSPCSAPTHLRCAGVPPGLLASPNAPAPGSLRSPFACAPTHLRCAGVPPGLLALPNAPAPAASRPPVGGGSFAPPCTPLSHHPRTARRSEASQCLPRRTEKVSFLLRSNPSVPLRFLLYFPNSISCNSLCACVTSPLQPCCFSPSRLA